MPPTGFKRSRALWDNARRPHDTQKQQWLSYIRAILYELQPIRSSEIDIPSWARKAQSLWQAITQFITTTLPSWTTKSFTFVSKMTLKQWMVVAGVLGYYAFIRYVHYALDAGPVVVILTCLVAIFTVGLSDKQNEDGLSAYSVFNRGFQRLLGSMDANEILAQHVGGAGFMPAMPPPEVHPQRPRARAAPVEERPPEPAPNNGDADEEQLPRDDGRGGSRKTGKKARRQNLEQRREIRRQREAAIAMGFGGGEEEAAIAMNRLVEDQVANPNE